MAGFTRSVCVLLHQTERPSSVIVLNHQVVGGCSILRTIRGQRSEWVIAGAVVHGLLRREGLMGLIRLERQSTKSGQCPSPPPILYNSPTRDTPSRCFCALARDIT